jgi:2-keto-4-pentenoate hydratase/2-oxohepta-3-ene-1,7-dioic acid hydratase in catechol pathway
VQLVSYADRSGATFGAVVGEGVIDLGRRLPDFADLRALLGGGGAALERARAVVAGSDPDALVGAISFLPPVPTPARILCAGVNYDAHRRETGRDPNVHPTIFTRFPSSLVGHGAGVEKPAESDRFDWEGELAVVIGTPGRRIDVGSALDHVAGYSCFMDGSVRDYQRMSSQFTPGKNFDRSGSFGPWLVTADEVPDPTALTLQTVVDGEVVQDTRTDLMIHSVAELIAFCSTFTTLEPGDVIATGTPGGVGDRRDPPRYLEVGATVEVAVSGVGRLVNPVVAG